MLLLNQTLALNTIWKTISNGINKIFDRQMTENVNRTAVSEAASASHYTRSSTFTGYITFIGAIWALSFSLLHLAKIYKRIYKNLYIKLDINDEALMHRVFKMYKSILARRQITYFSTLQTHENISLYRHSVWVKKMLYYSNISYLNMSFWWSKIGDFIALTIKKIFITAFINLH